METVRNFILLTILATLLLLMLWCSKSEWTVNIYTECKSYFWINITDDNEIIVWLCDALYEIEGICLEEPVESEGWHRCVRDYDLIKYNLEELLNSKNI